MDTYSMLQEGLGMPKNANNPPNWSKDPIQWPVKFLQYLSCQVRCNQMPTSDFKMYMDQWEGQNSQDMPKENKMVEK